VRKKSSTLLFAALVGPQGAPNIEIKNLRLIESQQSQKHFELAANTGQVFRDQKLVALDKVLGAIYSTPGNPFQIQGESGLLSSESNDFQIRDSVVITSPDNYRIETNDIDYNSDERILSTDEKVTLKTQTGQAQELSLEAQGLRVITRLHQYELLQDVVAQQAQAGGRLTIRSRSAVLNPQQSLSSFIGSAQLNSKDMKLRGDRLEIQMSQGSQRIEKILMVQKESEFVRVSLPSIEVESCNQKPSTMREPKHPMELRLKRKDSFFSPPYRANNASKWKAKCGWRSKDEGPLVKKPKWTRSQETFFSNALPPLSEAIRKFREQ